jgi:phosphoglycerate dehydrogenase-like enzyme
VAAGHEDHLANAGGVRLLHGVLHQRLVDHREHLLGQRLGRRKKAGAEAGHREDRVSYGHLLTILELPDSGTGTAAAAQKGIASVDLLVIDPIDADVMRWLASRHRLQFAPEFAFSPRELRRALYNVRAAIVPSSVSIDAETLDFAPVLRAVGRVSAGSENIDLEACERRKVEVVRSLTASARAEAEFMIGAMLTLLRRVPVRAPDGSVAGRELGGATIGLVGMPPSARTIAQLLTTFGVKILGYDPALHATDPSWADWQVTPAGLREIVERADVLCVQLDYFSRYTGLLGDRFLRHSKPNQVVVSTAHSRLFDEGALAAALRSGRIAAAWLDSVEPGALDPHRPLAGIETLQVTPRVAATTRESRQRSAWAVARRIDELLEAPASAPADFRSTIPGALADLEADSMSP